MPSTTNDLQDSQTPRSALRSIVAAPAVAALVLSVASCSASSPEDEEGRQFVHGYGPSCLWTDEEPVPNDDPDVDVRRGVIECRDEMSDARVTGLDVWTLTEPFYVDFTSEPRTGRFEASIVLTPDEGDGAWRGTGFGSDLLGTPNRSTFHAELLGEGEYEGLVYRMWGSAPVTTAEAGEEYEYVGYIESID